MDGWPLRDLAVSLQRRDDITNPTNPSSIKISMTVEIILIAVGGGLVLLTAGLVTWCLIRRRRRKRRLPEASSPIGGGFFNPNALPQNPLAQDTQQHQRNISNISNPVISDPQMGIYRQPSENQAPTYSANHDFSMRSQTPIGNVYGQMQAPSRGTTPAPHEFAMQQQPMQQTRPLSQRRGNEGPAPLKLNTKLRAPSGVGLERVNATAWGVRGRHVDANGNYYGSVAHQGGQAPEKSLPAMPQMPAQYGTPQPQPERAVYGDDEMYAERYEEQEHQNPLGRYATPEPLRHGTPQPARYATPQPPVAAANPYRKDIGNPYAAAAHNQNAYGGYGGYGAAYSDAASSHYGGHSRQVSDDREHAPTGWL